MARKPFPLEGLFAASDSLMRAAGKLSEKNGREAVAALLPLRHHGGQSRLR